MQIRSQSGTLNNRHPPHPRRVAVGRHSAAEDLKAAVARLHRNPFSIEAAFWIVVVSSGALLSWLGEHRPSELPLWMPWEFSWLECLAAVLAIWWFAKGVGHSPSNDRPAIWRQASYVCGILICYGAVQTHYDYLAQHMFFFNRIQHLGLHHVGPFLIALGWPGAAIKRGMPAPLRRLTESSPVVSAVSLLQRPWLSAGLFVGLIGFWLVPEVHLRAMLSIHLYNLMNWSMVLDGVAFWYLVLDPRPPSLARLTVVRRSALAIGVVPPQFILGAFVAVGGPDLYPSFDLCGRLLADVTAALDQEIGGLLIAIPATMMSLIALLVIASKARPVTGR
jgi:putative membrane protein